MAILKYRTRPEPWASHRERAKYAWLIPLFAIGWVWSWLAYDSILAGEIPALCPSSLVLLEDVKRV
jgi:hypothetical protein